MARRLTASTGPSMVSRIAAFSRDNPLLTYKIKKTKAICAKSSQYISQAYYMPEQIEQPISS